MDDLDLIRYHEELARKFDRIETEMAACTTAGELFETLVTGIETVFGVPFVWISLLQRPETSALFHLLCRSPLLKHRLNHLRPEAFLSVVADTRRPLLANGDLKPFFRLLPPVRKYLIRSIAVCPLQGRGCLIGSLNLGDVSPTRYEPGMDTNRLARFIGRFSAALAERLPA